MSDINVKEALRKWRRKYGSEEVGKKYGNVYFRIPIDKRRRFIAIFLRWMKMHGFGKEHFKTSTFLSELVDVCFGSAPASDLRKRKAGIEALKEELEDVLITEVFEKKSKTKKNSIAIIKPIKFDPESLPQQNLSDDKTEWRGKDVDHSIYNNIPDPKIEFDQEMCELLDLDPNE